MWLNISLTIIQKLCPQTIIHFLRETSTRFTYDSDYRPLEVGDEVLNDELNKIKVVSVDKIDGIVIKHTTLTKQIVVKTIL